MIRRSRPLASVRRLHRDARGATLTELLVGTVIGAMVMGVVATSIFTTNDLRKRADDRSQFAGDVSITSLSFDRDGTMATNGASAKTQTSSVSCATTIDLGFQEGGASVRYRTVAGSPSGPLWFQRVSGSGTRTMMKNVSSCSWQAVQVGTGRYTIVVTFTLVGASGEAMTLDDARRAEAVVMSPARPAPASPHRGRRRLHRDERGQSLAIILTLVTVLFLMGSALAVHASVALRTTVANEAQAGDLYAADAGAELGMWWQRNGNAGNPPNITVNGLTVNTTVGITGFVPCPTPTPIRVTGFEYGAVSQSGGGLFSNVNGAGVTADNAVARTGAYSLGSWTPPGANHNARIAAAGNTAVSALRAPGVAPGRGRRTSCCPWMPPPATTCVSGIRPAASD